MEEAIREIRETAAKVLKVMGTDFAFANFTPDEINDIHESTAMMVSDMETAIKGDETSIQRDEKEWIARILNIMLAKVMIKTFDSTMKESLMAYILLAKNWNQIACFVQIDESSTALQNALDYTQSVAAMIEVMKHLTDHANRIMANHPPAWEVSRHYLQTLRDKLERKTEDGNRE